MNTNKRKKRRPREHSAVAPRVLSPATPVLTRAYAAATAALNARNAAKTATLAAQHACTAVVAAKARRAADKAEASLRVVKRKMARQALLLQGQKTAIQQHRIREQQHELRQSEQDQHVLRLEAKLSGAKGRLHAMKMRSVLLASSVAMATAAPELIIYRACVRVPPNHQRFKTGKSIFK